MIKEFNVGIDIDLTLTSEVAGYWAAYIHDKVGFDYIRFNDDLCAGVASYDLRVYAGENNEGLNLFSYWTSGDIYKGLLPMKDSVDSVRLLVDAGCSITFVSFCLNSPVQIYSKMMWLKSLFPFISDGEFNFISSKKKTCAAIDVMIDDRLAVMKGLRGNVHKILLKTPYTQDCTFDDVVIAEDWQAVLKEVLAYKRALDV